MPIMSGDAKFLGKVTQNLVTRLTGYFVVGATGAVGTQSSTATTTSGGQQCGVSVSRTATGDYRLTLHRGYKRIIRGDATVHLPTLGAAATGAIDANIQGAVTGNYTGATPVTATGLGITTTNAAGALADPQNPCVVTFDLELADL